jgi:transposase InsO family protein
VDLIRYVVKAVVLEGLSVREVAAAHGVSRSWVYECLARYRAEGDLGLFPRSRRPHSSPSRVAAEVEDQIVALRKDLAGQGLDAGPHTIAWHLAGRGDPVPSVATIWRVLRRRGLITPQPQKRPRSSYTRFCADLPNERWQMDITHWQLAGGASAEILNIIDDHSRFLIASAARRAYRAADVVTVFRHAADQHGPPASMLADNGAVFTAAPRHGACVIEGELIAAGITYSHSRPYHPQTCGKVERFHQTLKKWLTPPAAGIHHPRPASPTRPLRRLLQHPPAPPGDRPPDTGHRLHRPDQSPPRWAADPRSRPLPGPPGRHRQRRLSHPAPSQQALPHRRRATARRNQGHHPGRRPQRPHPHPRRDATTQAHPGPSPQLPATAATSQAMMS